MVKITFLGGCREVGRSAILIESNSGEKCILDYGVRFKGKTRLPHDFNKDNLKAIALTHSHIDHSGAIPYLYKNLSVPLFTNPVTLAITKVLVKDMIKISDFYYPFGYQELDKLINKSYFLENGQRKRISDSLFLTFFNAGHIPGSVSILVEVDNKKIFYTGDINTKSTNLVKATNFTNLNEIPEIDVLIVESTYALRDHPPREKLEKEFTERIIDITENNGKVLVPAFGVARSQEALLILHKYNYYGKIFVDGLARKISNVFMDYPESLKNINFYKTAIKRAKFISGKKGRNQVKNSNGVIIAPSGMLKGGAAIDFVKSFLNDPASAIYLVGYQVEGSPGRVLLDSGFLEFNSYKNKDQTFNFKIKAKCDYDYFDFSSHADGKQLKEYVKNFKFKNGSNNVFCVHGDPRATTTLSSELAKNSYNSIAPETGEVYYI
ncbi:MAG: MBL fold metallo-hydrolase [Promethearchaeota archaeon]